MSRLVNDLLTLARADAGRATFARDEVDLSDLTLEAVERLAPLARTQGIVLTVGDLPPLGLTGDATYLTRMLVNVIENAIRYTAGVGHNVRIDAGERCVDGVRQAWVRVSDDGPGIAAEHLPHLFERFYRADRVRERRDAADESLPAEGGSGLGLSIVQWVARSHGGDVLVESALGHGATFEIRLPLAPRDSSTPPAPSALPELTNNPP
jgi:signal transduction histidine kinase